MQETISDAIRDAFVNLWLDVVNIIPELLAAFVVFIVGLIIASIAGAFTRRIVHTFKVDKLADRLKVHNTLEKMGLTFKFSDLFGTVVKWFFIIVFLNASVEILGWTQIIAFLNDVLRYIPQVLAAIIILTIGLIVASFVEGAVVKGLTSARTPVKSPATLGSIAKWSIVAFTLMATLTQLHIAEDLISILFGAVLFTFVLAFGLAGKERAGKFIDQIFV